MDLDNFLPIAIKKWKGIKDKDNIRKIFLAPELSEFNAINVMPLIYDEKSIVIQ